MASVSEVNVDNAFVEFRLPEGIRCVADWIYFGSADNVYIYYLHMYIKKEK